MTWHKWKRVLRIVNGPSKQDRQVAQRRARRTAKQNVCAQPTRERFWERWNTRNYT